MCCTASSAPLPAISTSPMCETSNSPAAVRTAMCSAVMPEYSTGMSQPPNGTMRAPRDICDAWSGVFLSEAETESAINEGFASEEANPRKVLCESVKGQGAERLLVKDGLLAALGDHFGDVLRHQIAAQQQRLLFVRAHPRLKRSIEIFRREGGHLFPQLAIDAAELGHAFQVLFANEGARVIDQEEVPVAVVNQVALVAIDVGDQQIEHLHACELLAPLRLGSLRRFLDAPAAGVLDP